MCNEVVDFVKWMRDAREGRGWSQRELATQAKVGLSTIQALETGRATSITSRVKEKISRALSSEPVAIETLSSMNHSGIEHFRPLMMRLASLVSEKNFDERVCQVAGALHIPKVLAIVMVFENELKK